MNENNNFNVESQAVQCHINTLQSIILRMASNSSSCKTWCITLVSAILVVAADKGQSKFTIIALLPIMVFAVIDAYYLALEQEFRHIYNEFVKTLHDSKIIINDIYTIKPNPIFRKTSCELIKRLFKVAKTSPSTNIFYPCLFFVAIILILIL